MNKISTVIASLALIVLFLFANCTKSSNETAEIDETAGWIMIDEPLYFENVNMKWQSLFTYENDRPYYIEKDSYIVKFAYDSDGYLGYHACVLEDISENTDVSDKVVRAKGSGSACYIVKDDYFTVYNISAYEREIFKTQSEYVQYCKENNLTLFDFVFSNGYAYMQYDRTDISDRVQFNEFENPFVDQLLIDDEVVFEGYISNCKMISKSVVEFKIEIPDTAFLEFPKDSNPGLTLSSTPLKHHFFKNLVREKVYFDNTLRYDIDKKQVVSY